MNSLTNFSPSRISATSTLQSTPTSKKPLIDLSQMTDTREISKTISQTVSVTKGLGDEVCRYFFALSLVDRHACALASKIQEFQLTPNHQLEIAKKILLTKPMAFLEHSKNFEITDRKALSPFLKKIPEKGQKHLQAWIYEKDESHLYRLAKEDLRKKGIKTFFANLSSYGLSDKYHLKLVRKRFLGSASILIIQYFPFKAFKDLKVMELYLKEYLLVFYKRFDQRQFPNNPSTFIPYFKIDNIDVLFNLSKIMAEKEGWLFIINSKKFIPLFSQHKEKLQELIVISLNSSLEIPPFQLCSLLNCLKALPFSDEVFALFVDRLLENHSLLKLDKSCFHVINEIHSETTRAKIALLLAKHDPEALYNYFYLLNISDRELLFDIFKAIFKFMKKELFSMDLSKFKIHSFKRIRETFFLIMNHPLKERFKIQSDFIKSLTLDEKNALVEELLAIDPLYFWTIHHIFELPETSDLLQRCSNRYQEILDKNPQEKKVSSCTLL